MPDKDSRTGLQDRIDVLVGLQLSIARNAADMTIFHFGPIRPHSSGSGTVGAYALHIQCPWRLTAGARIVTGTSDRFVGPAEGLEPNDDDRRMGNLQLVRIEELLQGFDETTRSFVNATGDLFVTKAVTDGFGGLDMALSGGYRLQLFPDGSIEEDWRFVEVQGRHVVVGGGRVRIDE
jgi:hypothetical protein